MARLSISLLLAALSVAAAFMAPTSSLSLSRAAVQPQGISMAVTKATRTNRRNYEYNKMYKSEMKTKIKKVLVACKAAEPYGEVQPLLNAAQSIIDKNVKRGIMHKNTAARRKSLLTLKVKALEPMAAPAAAPAEEAAAPAEDA